MTRFPYRLVGLLLMAASTVVAVLTLWGLATVLVSLAVGWPQ